MNSDHLQLFVGNLPHNCTDADLRDLFQAYGKVGKSHVNVAFLAVNLLTEILVGPTFAVPKLLSAIKKAKIIS